MVHSAKTILVITCERDAHADHIMIRLEGMGHRALWLDPYQILGAGQMVQSISSTSHSGEVKCGGTTVRLKDVYSVWYRKPRTGLQLPEGLTLREKRFTRMEALSAIGGLWAAMDCYWVSQPDLINAAGHKAEQLMRAAKFGMTTPRTLITTSATAALEFLESCGGRVVYKTLSGPTLGARNGVRPDPEELRFATKTTLLIRPELEAHGDAIAATPCMFQEYVEKRVELRVTVIEDDIFVGEIDSQAQPETRIDWRHYHVPMVVKKGKIPDKIAERILAFVRSYGLPFSTLDIVVRPDGEHVFIENNPNGQWLFVERLVPELKMTDALVGCLVRGRNGKHDTVASCESPSFGHA